MKKYIIGIDQGTTSSRVVVVDRAGDVIVKEQMEVEMFEEKNGELLQHPKELVETITVLLKRIFTHHKIKPKEVAGIGITNQRETTILWNKYTKEPIYDAISWQSKHTNFITNKWIEDGLEAKVLKKTGLTINPYFSASKIVYILEKVKPDHKDILFGTVDSYIIYCLTNGKVHKTDITNASRTMLFNIFDEKWDQELLNLFKIPVEILPEVVANDHEFGYYEYDDVKIPIFGVIGDQQASLFGHQCFEKGSIKATYGTGGFLLVNTGDKPYLSDQGLLTTIAWKRENKTIYALEGSIFICGAAVQWLRDELGIIIRSSDSEKSAKKSIDNEVYVVPAFVGLGTPYWDSEVKASILGLKRKSNKDDIAKATLDSIAYQIEDVLRLIKSETKLIIKELSVDGGASENGYLMQFQSDISNIKIIRNKEVEVTALGACYIAGLKAGFWKDLKEVTLNKKIEKLYYPRMNELERARRYHNWLLAVQTTINFKPKQ